MYGKENLTMIVNYIAESIKKKNLTMIVNYIAESVWKRESDNVS
jgi:hypothetical protein